MTEVKVVISNFPDCFLQNMSLFSSISLRVTTTSECDNKIHQTSKQSHASKKSQRVSISNWFIMSTETIRTRSGI